MENLMTRKQVASKLGVDPFTVRRYEKSGALPVAGRINNRPRYDITDVEKLLKRQPKKFN